MASRSSILAGDFDVFYAAENNRKQVKWTGSATGTRTLNELYSALQDLFDEPAQMDDLVPIRADTPDIYRMISQWFVDDDTVQHLTSGSLFTDGWAVGTTEHVKVIGYINLGSPPSDLSVHDIGRTIVGGSTTDIGTILDFNSQRGLLWIRPDNPVLGNDDFDDGDEGFTIQADAFDEVWQVEFVGATNFVDQTSGANDAADANWTVFPATESAPPGGGSPLSSDGPADYAAMGFAQEFSSLTFDNVSGGATQGAGGVVAWEYWNGTAWAALTSVVDGTSNFTTAKADGQVVSWDAPTDWATTSLNSGAQLFYVRARVLTVFSTNPIYDQGFVTGVGAGTFASHSRHGCASTGGEAAWAGITTIGAIQDNTHIYIFQEDLDKPAGDFEEEKVIATKGTSDWWEDGQIDVLLKTKEADSIFGQLPNATRTSTSGVATVFARKFSSLFSHFIAEALSTSGGNTVVPLASGNDLNNQSGYRTLTLSGDSGTFAVGDTISRDAEVTAIAVITDVSGASPTRTLEYYLINDPLTNFVNGDTVDAIAPATGTGTLATGPSDTGPALSNGITIVFGATTEDINNGNLARPYSIRIDPNNNSLTVVYERLKFLTRRGSTAAFQGQDGEEYLGNETQIEYSSFLHGPNGDTLFQEGDKVFDQTTNAEGIIVADHPDTGSPVLAGDLIIKAIRGTFTATNTISDSPDPEQQAGSVLQFEAPSTFIDITSAVGSPPSTGSLFPTTSEIGDILYVGADQVFARVGFDLATPGVGAATVLLWEYFNGTIWTELGGGGSPSTGTVATFVDQTDNLKAAGTSFLWFYPPRDWEPTTVNSAAIPCAGPFYYIRATIQAGAYTTEPIANQILIEDNVTATADTIRTITPVSASPFGTLAGGVFFGAQGVTLTISNLFAGEEQSFQLIDDDGVTQVPPNTVSVTVTNLLCGDAVAVFRRTGTDINKTQFTLAAGNNLGDPTVVMNGAIPADNPTNDNSKVRIISASGVEHRYRYDSFAAATFTLSPASTGTAATASQTIIDDAAADFVTDEVEVGDYVAHVDGRFARVTIVNSAIQLTTEALGVNWDSGASTYSVNTLVENYATPFAYVPFIERIAGGCGSPLTATTEGNQLVQSVSIDVRVVVRNAGNILPFAQDAAIGTTGLSLAAIRNPDSIFT